MLKKTLILLLILPALWQQAVAATADNPTIWHSAHGHFNVSYESQLNPIVINQIHNWTLHVTDANGAPVEGAVIAVKGGMPAHNHGLATQPTVEPAENGDYQLQGLRFHMLGHWELTLDISANGTNDEVLISLEL